MPKFDVFICHASEDKNSLVKPLATALREFGIKVWYDEFTLSPGDSLSKSIDHGLSESRFGAVILSPSFFSKGWPEYELRGLIAREIGISKVVIPIWHHVDRAEVLKYSPPLADKVAIRSDELSPNLVAVRLIEVIRPDLFDMILRRAAWIDMRRKAPRERVRIDTLKFGPVRHHKLPDKLLCRIRLIRAALLNVYESSMQEWIDGFSRDLHPADEVDWWEYLAACFLEYAHLKALPPERLKAAFRAVFSIFLGSGKSELEEELACLPENAYEEIREIASVPRVEDGS